MRYFTERPTSGQSDGTIVSRANALGSIKYQQCTAVYC